MVPKGNDVYMEEWSNYDFLFKTVTAGDLQNNFPSHVVLTVLGDFCSSSLPKMPFQLFQLHLSAQTQSFRIEEMAGSAAQSFLQTDTIKLRFHFIIKYTNQSRIYLTGSIAPC